MVASAARKGDPRSRSAPTTARRLLDPAALPPTGVFAPAPTGGHRRRTVPGMSPTHEVSNQVPPLVGHDPIGGDTVLAEACLRHADAATLASLADLGRLAGSEQAQEWGRVANENPPRLRTHDRYGHRIDEVEFHPYWHDLMRTAVENGLAGAPWAEQSARGAAPGTPAPRPHPPRRPGVRRGGR